MPLLPTLNLWHPLSVVDSFHPVCPERHPLPASGYLA